MSKGDDSLPKFFKVYLPDDSGDDLDIPISFNSCLPKSMPKNVIVRSIYGKIWKLELRKCYGDVERFVMVNGWKSIVKDEDLKGGEFLAFEFDGSRFFNFCIYGQRTCKRLASLVQDKEVKDESDGEYGRSSDDIIVLDDDEEDDDDDDDDAQDYGDEGKCSEDIIVLDDADDEEEEEDEDEDEDDEDDDDGDGDDGEDDDGDGDDGEDYGEEDKSNKDTIVLDDDDDDDDDQDYGDKEKSSEDVIVLDDDDDEDDDDDYADDENERVRVETERKEKGSSGDYIDGEDNRQYLDNEMNPFFIVNQNLQRKVDARIPAKVINDYGLRFPEFIYLIDPLEKKFGKLKRKVEGRMIKAFDSITRRNQVKSSDKMICELLRESNGLVCEIKVHVIRG